jgi:hypothetical protein
MPAFGCLLYHGNRSDSRHEGNIKAGFGYRWGPARAARWQGPAQSAGSRKGCGLRPSGKSEPFQATIAFSADAAEA